MCLYGRVTSELALKETSHGAILFHDGRMVFVPAFLITTPCRGDVVNFPFDEQRCTISAGSWLHHQDQINVTLDIGHDNFFEFYHPNQQWTLTLEEIITNDFEDQHFKSLIYRTINYELRVKRNATFSFFSLILPGVLLNILLTVIFIQPPDSEDAITIGEKMQEHE